MKGVCRRFIVSGRVQGVFYRDSTRKKASELKITGWVKNLDNGNVEVLACGDIDSLNTLEVWLWQGPTHASVENVVQEDHEFERHEGFVII